MKLNKNLFSISLFLIILAIGGYFVFSNRSESPSPEKKEGSQETEQKSLQWNDLLPEIKQVLKESIKDLPIEEAYPVKIHSVADITEDGTEEALIYLGTGGAYTDYLVLMEIENEKPVLAKIKSKNGEISFMTFLSGASVRHATDVKMEPQMRALYSSYLTLDEFGKIEECLIEIYKWNAEEKTYDFDENLSSFMQEKSCKSLENMEPKM